VVLAGSRVGVDLDVDKSVPFFLIDVPKGEKNKSRTGRQVLAGAGVSF
jgi:hypothetical protein